MVNASHPLYSADQTGGTSTLNGSHDISSLTLIDRNLTDDTSDDLVLMSIDRPNGLDINVPTVLQAPSAYDHTLMVIDNQ